MRWVGAYRSLCHTACFVVHISAVYFYLLLVCCIFSAAFSVLDSLSGWRCCVLALALVVMVDWMVEFGISWHFFGGIGTTHQRCASILCRWLAVKRCRIGCGRAGGWRSLWLCGLSSSFSTSPPSFIRLSMTRRCGALSGI